jgi:hypothetical protein
MDTKYCGILHHWITAFFFYSEKKVTEGRKDCRIGNLTMEMAGHDWSVLKQLGRISICGILFHWITAS